MKDSHDFASTVLIVDDDQDTRSIFGKFLAQAGMQVVTAESGKECLSMLRERPIDLILLDLLMPETDGIVVLRQIRESSAASVPVLIVTVWDNPEARSEANRLHAREYLIKPVFREVLVSKVLAHLHDSRRCN